MESVLEIKEQLNRIETGLLSQKKVLTFDEVCRFTGLAKSYLYKLTSTGKIPHVKPRGKVIYFEREAIENWLLQNPVKTAQESEAEALQYVTMNERGA